MIRYLLTAAALTLTLAASAVKPTKTMHNEYIHVDVMPGEVGYKGKSEFFLKSRDDNNTIIERINGNFDILEKFIIPDVKIPATEETIYIQPFIPGTHEFDTSAEYSIKYSTREHSEPRSFWFDYLSYSDLDNNYVRDDIIASQTLFNTDEEYEVIIPIIELSDEELRDKPHSSRYLEIRVPYIDEYGNEQTLSTSNYKVRYRLTQLTGLAVVSAKTGETITIFELPEPQICSEYISELDAKIVKFDGMSYLEYSFWDYDNDTDTAYYYALDDYSAIKSPVMTKRVRVKPGIVNRGENVMVNVEGEKGISTITLTGMNGMTEQRMAGRGEKSAAIATGNLSSGVHIVGVQTADGENSFSKIIVK